MVGRSRHFIWACAVVLTAVMTCGPSSFAFAHDPRGGSAVGKLPPPVPDAEKSFLDENEVAMATMMANMAITPTGDVDRDFVAMMVPHHQGAIDMARALLRHSQNEPLRRLAQEIIVTQQQEIAAMRFAVGETLPPSPPSPTQIAPEPQPQQPMANGGLRSHDAKRKEIQP